VKLSLKEPPCELVDPGLRKTNEPFVAPNLGEVGGNGLGRYTLASKPSRTRDRGHPFEGRVPLVDG
jgi:hypothetical protein